MTSVLVHIERRIKRAKIIITEQKEKHMCTRLLNNEN